MIAGSFALAGLAPSANAGPLPAISAPDAANLVETVGWRERYYRRYGVWPTGPRGTVVPPAASAVVVDDDGDVVIVAPLRPASCGQYHYWNGVACVDARYNDPYLGPK
jgi:hypothetical protein